MKIINNITTLFQRRKYLRNNATPQEASLWNKLKNSQTGNKWRRQHSLGGYIVDFYCPVKRLVIEVDGPEHLTKQNKELDKIRSEFLAGLNIQVIRFTNEDIEEKLDFVISEIKYHCDFPLLIEEGSKGW